MSKMNFKGLNSRSQQGWFLLEAPEGESLRCLFPSRGSWHPLAPGCITRISASVVTSLCVEQLVSLFLFLVKTFVITQRAHLANLGHILITKSLIISSKFLLPYKVTLENPGIRTYEHFGDGGYLLSSLPEHSINYQYCEQV